jgi:hypothetical protein
MMRGAWRKTERGLFESADGHWRIANAWELNTELRHRWLVAERRSSSSGWNRRDGDHVTLHDACAHVENLTSTAGAGAMNIERLERRDVDADPRPRCKRSLSRPVSPT